MEKVILLSFVFIFLLAFCGSVAAANNTTICVSVAINGSESNGYSYEPSISSDGRYIAFSSYASNLVAGDINGHKDVFVRDRLLNTTTLVSVSSTGEQGDGDSSQPFISGDGRYVAFTSYATNLVTGDTNGVSDIFVRDLLLNITERVSVSSMGEQGNGDSSSPSISGDGRYVAFTSGEARFSEARFESFNTERSSNSQHAGNLVPDDNNGFHDIFVYDRTSRIIKRINVSSTGREANGDSFQPSISTDGRYVAFSSGANNLVTGDNNGVDDIFVYDQTLNTIKRVSISTNRDEGNGYSSKPSISANGRYIAFTSSANNLVWGDNNHRDDVFVHDQISGITERVSVLSTGEEFSVDCGEPSISGDGRNVAFSLQDIRPAGAPLGVDLPPDYSYFILQVLVYDRISKTTRVVSISRTGDLGNGNSGGPSINADGTAVAFSSWADNLVANDTNGEGDVFVRGSEPSSSTPANPPYTPPTPVNLPEPVNPPVIKPIIVGSRSPDKTIKTPINTFKSYFKSIKTNNSVKTGGKVSGFIDLGVKASGPGVKPGAYSFNNFSIYGPLTPYLKGKSNPLSGLFKYNDEAWKINNKESVYGWLAGILNHPMNPFSHIFYTWDKLGQAGQKAWRTGNVWDFFDANFYHIHGYSNMDKIWGGQNIKTLLDWGFGIDENGDLSVGNFLLLLFSIIPIGRVASIAGKALSGILSKAGLKMGVNLADNVIIKGVKDFVSDLTKRFGLFDPERWKNAISWIGNVLLPNPVGWFADIFKGLAKLTGNEKLIAAATAFSNFQFRRGLGDLANLLVNPDPIRKIGNVYGEVGGFLNRNLNYLIDSSKKFVNGAVNTVKSVGNIVNKINTTVKQLIPKAVTTVKKAVNKVVTNVKTVAKKAVTTAKQIVTTAKKVVNKAVNTAKKVVKKAVNTAKKAVNKVVTKAVNTVKRTAKKAVNTAKKVATKAKTAAKKAVTTVKKTAKKVVTKVKTAAKKAVNTAKKVATKAKTATNKAVNTVKKAASSAVNWVKSKIRWPW